MFGVQAKKMLVMNILNILKKYSDADHRLSQKDIIDYLKKDYDMDAERKAIKRNIDNLIDEGYDINYTEIERGEGDGKNVICSDFYLVRDFEDSELRLLIDGLIFSKYIPYSQCKELIKKLEGLSNKYFSSRIKYIQLLKEKETANQELFYTIDIIDEAISKGYKVKFNYCSYDINKQLVYRKNDDGNDKVYIASPYHMVAANSRYYLICVFDNHEDIANIRVDRIKNIELVDEKVKANKTASKDIDLPKHMMEHLYMLSGESDTVKFKFPSYLINDVVDWFGHSVTMKQEDDDTIIATANINLNAMKIWAMQYGDHVTVLSPSSLVDEIKESLSDMTKRYNEAKSESSRK